MNYILLTRLNGTGRARIYLIILSFFSTLCVSAQAPSAVVVGVVKDKTTDEALPGASVYWSTSMEKGVITDIDGLFSLAPLALPAELTISYVGYSPSVRTITDKELGKELKFFLNPEEQALAEFVVNEARENNNVVSLDIGKSSLPVEVLKSIPALFGEVDLLRGIQ
jgi:hypothetical protein